MIEKVVMQAEFKFIRKFIFGKKHILESLKIRLKAKNQTGFSTLYNNRIEIMIRNSKTEDFLLSKFCWLNHPFKFVH